MSFFRDVANAIAGRIVIIRSKSSASICVAIFTTL